MSRRRRYAQRNPLTSTDDLLIGVGVIAALALGGYVIYVKSQAATASAAANTTSASINIPNNGTVFS
jgi:hypothetical protein